MTLTPNVPNPRRGNSSNSACIPTRPNPTAAGARVSPEMPGTQNFSLSRIPIFSLHAKSCTILRSTVTPGIDRWTDAPGVKERKRVVLTNCAGGGLESTVFFELFFEG